MKDHVARRRRDFSKRVHDLRERGRRRRMRDLECDHRGVGLPGCPTCDPTIWEPDDADG